VFCQQPLLKRSVIRMLQESRAGDKTGQDLLKTTEKQ
jgi:hypothetical protein